mgnify:CR=1 FL=1
MALATRDALLNFGMLHGRSVSDVLAKYSYTSSDRPRFGELVFAEDAAGLRIFRACRVMQANGMTQGVLSQRAALVTSTVTAAAGQTNDTTHLAATSAFTANNEEGKWCQINVAGAAAPEGECAYVTDNTISQLTFDSGYPLSAAPETGDTFSDWAIHHVINSATTTDQINVTGIVMSDPDTTGDFAWLQIYGFHPGVTVDTSGPAITTGLAGVSGTAGVLPRNAETSEDFIGFFPMATSSTASVAGFYIDLWYRQAALA